MIGGFPAEFARVLPQPSANVPTDLDAALSKVGLKCDGKTLCLERGPQHPLPYAKHATSSGDTGLAVA